MGLTTERIVEICAHLRDTVGCGDMKLARAIEAEVRKQDDALILQLVEALQGSISITMGKIEQRNTALIAGRAWLEGKP